MMQTRQRYRDPSVLPSPKGHRPPLTIDRVFVILCVNIREYHASYNIWQNQIKGVVVISKHSIVCMHFSP